MLDPNIALWANYAGAGAAAAAMHTTALAGTGYGSTKPWPPKWQFLANLISTALVGLSLTWAFSKAPWFVMDVPGLLIASALTGHTLGPLGVNWVFKASVKGAQSLPGMSKIIPDPPSDTASQEPAKPVQEEAKGE